MHPDFIYVFISDLGCIHAFWFNKKFLVLCFCSFVSDSSTTKTAAETEER